MNPSHPYLPRIQEDMLKELFKHFPVVVVSGARQVGKSTLLEHAYPEFERIIFDPVLDIENAKQDPDLFLNNHKTPIILDEIQYAPELIPAIKRRLDKNRSPGQYLITGSQQWGVMKLLSESLAGRATFLDLDGLSLSEKQKSSSQDFWLKKWLTSSQKKFSQIPFSKTLNQLLWEGSLPETHFLPEKLLPNFFESYVRTYVERDIRQMSEISDLHLFNRFYKLCGALFLKHSLSLKFENSADSYQGTQIFTIGELMEEQKWIYFWNTTASFIRLRSRARAIPQKGT